MTPCLLALDTATESLAVALLTPAGRWHLDAAGGAAASVDLLPAVQRLLAEAGISLSALDAVAFGQGPGAFTGLRTACAVAQGLGLGIGKPLLPIDSLAIVADAAVHDAGSPTEGATALWVAMDARMDEVYAAAYQRLAAVASPADGPATGARRIDQPAAGAPPAHQPGAGASDGAPCGAPVAGWQAVSPPRLYTLAALAAQWTAQPPGAVAGSAVTAFGDRLPLAGARLHGQPAGRAAALLRLAHAAWAGGQGLGADQALPLYLRDKVALTTAERAAAKAAAA